MSFADFFLQNLIKLPGFSWKVSAGLDILQQALWELLEYASWVQIPETDSTLNIFSPAGVIVAVLMECDEDTQIGNGASLYDLHLSDRQTE